MEVILLQKVANLGNIGDRVKVKPGFGRNYLLPQGKEALAPGKHVLEFDWKYDGPGLGKGGIGTLKVDGKVVDSHPMPRSLPVGIGWVETFNVGIDTGTPVDDADYQVPFPFTGKIQKLTVKLGPEQLTPAERQMIYGAYRDRQ